MPAESRRRLLIVAALEALVVATPVALLLVLVAPLPWPVAVLLALLVGAAVVAWWWRTTPHRVLRALGAEQADERHHARYHNLVDGLCLSFGVERPALHVIDAPALNAASVAGGGQAAIACTRGLLERLDRVELEGVLAHELAQLRSGHSAAATAAVGLIGLPSLAGDGPVGRPLSGLGDALAPARDRVLAWVLGSERELEADRTAVGVTRYPPGLYHALCAIRDDTGTGTPASRATAPLWIHDPDGARRSGSGPATPLHPPIDERIDVLGEL